MNLYKINNRQIAPCIIAKAKIALKISNKPKNNIKTCSDDYWFKTIQHIAKHHNINDNKTINQALKRTDLYKK